MIQFYHDRTFGTIAVDVPDVSTIESQFVANQPIAIGIGKAFLNQKDNFSKKEGRRISLSRMEIKVLKPLTMMYQRDGSVNFHFANEEYSVLFRIFRGSERAYLIRASYYGNGV